MAAAASAVLLRRRLGQQLLALRRRAGLTGKDAGETVDRSGSWISRVEAGRVSIRPLELRVLLDSYGFTDAAGRRELERLAREGQRRDWWSKYSDVITDSYATLIGLEVEATSLLTYENAVVPGLLQTADYSRAIFMQSVPLVPADHIERRIEVRLKRQELLGKADAPDLQIVLDEAVLHRSIGGTVVFAGQMDRLLQETQRERISLRLLPFAHSERTVLATAFTIMTFAEDPDIVYVEMATGGVYEDDRETPAYRQIFEQLHSVALDEAATVAAIQQALERAR